MLFVYHSNRLEQLSQLFCDMTRRKPLSDPFTSETIIVQTEGIREWLRLELARKNGLAANLDFVCPKVFSWRIIQQVMPDLPRTSPFIPEGLIWQLMQLLPTLNSKSFPALSRYLEGGDVACFELASKLTAILQQYLEYRPDWLCAWGRGEVLDLGPDEGWQAELWRRLADSDVGYDLLLMQEASFSTIRVKHLPERVTLFGIAHLAPMHITLVNHLSRLINVRLFILNPCEAHLKDIKNSRCKLNLLQHEESLAPDCHPLLASFGKQGQTFVGLLTENMELEAHPAFEVPSGATLLARLQRDILQLNDPKQATRPLEAGDYSVEIHATHGAMRELEVLKNRLLTMFRDYPDINPSDVLVLTPDIDRYAPYIDAVFSTHSQARGTSDIPYCITARHITNQESFLASYAALLDLADSRFAAEQVLALLTEPSLLRRFGLLQGDVSFIRQWTREVGIRWGRNAAHKEALGFNADPLFTWRWGLDRLLLGTVLPLGLAGDESGLYAGLLPHSSAQGQPSEILGRFSACFRELEHVAEEWSHPTSLVLWSARLQNACKRLFDLDSSDEKASDVLHATLEKLTEDATQSGFKQSVGLPVVRSWLQRKLKLPPSFGLLSGGVTFCSMMPMRCIPSRVVCLIGMNDNAYPREEPSISFDLLKRHPRRGDYSLRCDDRHLFLEAILSAREKFYISYVGQSARSGETLPPSPLISELLDCLSTMCGKDLEPTWVARHPLQPFSPTAYDGRDSRLSSFEPTFSAALSQPKTLPRAFAVVLPQKKHNNIVNVHQFIRFWCNPVRTWLTDRLSIRLFEREEDLPVREPFVLERKARQTIRKQIVEALMLHRPEAPIRDRITASGLLPAAAIGQAWLEKEAYASVKFTTRLPEALSHETLPPESFHLQAAGLILVGEISTLRPEGQLSFIVGKINVAQLVALWLWHLILCAVRPTGVSCRSACYDEARLWQLKDEQSALALLEPWLVFWRQGQDQPLPFFSRTSWAYAEALAAEPCRRDKAMHKAHGKWSQSVNREGMVAQKDEATCALAFRNQQPLKDPLFIQMAEILLLPLAERLHRSSEDQGS